MKIDAKTCAWGLLILIAYSSFQSYSELSRRWERLIKNQRQNNYQVTTSQNHWEELTQFRIDWGQYFALEGDSSSSRHELFKQLKLGQVSLNPVQSKILKSETEMVIFQGASVGLSKTCVKNTASGFGFKSQSVGRLMESLDALHLRKSISFGDIKLINKNGKAEASIEDLCVFMRIGDQG